MIDQTSAHITEANAEIHRRRVRRDFYARLLAATDLVLAELEEMNRDGCQVIPNRKRREFAECLHPLPSQFRAIYVDGGHVQSTLDSVFDLQEALLRARHPDYRGDEDEGLEPD